MTVNAKGHVTSGSNPTTLNGYGITDAYTKTQVDTSLSGKANTSHGTHVSYGTSATTVGATSSAGTASTVSRSDHVHSLPTASSSTLGGVKIGSNISISSGAISVPTASGTQAGVTIVYPAANCTTFSSDSGTVTPLAVQKSAKMFAITRPSASTNKAITRYSNTTGDVQDSKIIIEDVTNTRDNSEAQVIAIPASGGKKMVYGYCTDQVDGTSFIGGIFDASATEYPYNQGLAIGGTSGNLLWKGVKVATTSDIPSKYAGSSSAGGSATSAVKLDTTTAGSATQPVYFTGGKPTACTYTLGKSVPSDAKFTDTTYGNASASASGLVSTGAQTLAGAKTFSSQITAMSGVKISGDIVADTAITRSIGSSTVPIATIYSKNHSLYPNGDNKTYGSMNVDTVGTTSVIGVSMLTLGNSTSEGTANNAKGRIRLYGNKSYYTQINGNASTANVTLTLPTTTGTLATTDNVSSAVETLAGNSLQTKIINASAQCTANAEATITPSYSSVTGVIKGTFVVGISAGNSSSYVSKVVPVYDSSNAQISKVKVLSTSAQTVNVSICVLYTAS